LGYFSCPQPSEKLNKNKMKTRIKNICANIQDFVLQIKP
jgi:hypothetical protein